MGSRPVGEWSNRSWMHGVVPDRMGLRSMRLVARGRMKPTSFWRAMAGAGGQLHDRGPCRNSIRTDCAAQQIFSDARASRGTSQKLQPPSLLPSFYIAPATSSLHRREPIEALFLLISE